MSSDTFSMPWGETHFWGHMPEKCPLCHVVVHTGEPRTYIFIGFVTEVQAVFRCPKCENLFIGYYAPTETIDPDTHFDDEGYRLELKALRPRKPYLQDVSETINEISPNFVKIYSEALNAQEIGLGQICGPGFRKAFEYLIKDYAKLNVKDDEQVKKIENIASSTVVNNYIGDSRIQEIAKRTLWLGNDETHYLRKWTEHDINDFVMLIRLTIHWIEMEALSKNYISGMPKE